MARIDLNDAIAKDAIGHMLSGAQRSQATSKKFALTTSPIVHLLPTWDAGDGTGARRPTHVKFTLGAAADLVYGAFDGQVAVVPTTSTVGTEKLDDGQVLAVGTLERIGLVAEAAATLTISYYWI